MSQANVGSRCKAGLRPSHMPVYLQSMDMDVTNAVFPGSDKTWGNSHMGVLFDLIGIGKCPSTCSLCVKHNLVI